MTLIKETYISILRVTFGLVIIRTFEFHKCDDNLVVSYNDQNFSLVLTPKNWLLKTDKLVFCSRCRRNTENRLFLEYNYV